MSDSQEEFCTECGNCVTHCECDDDMFSPTDEDVEGWVCEVCLK